MLPDVWSGRQERPRTAALSDSTETKILFLQKDTASEGELWARTQPMTQSFGSLSCPLTTQTAHMWPAFEGLAAFSSPLLDSLARRKPDSESWFLRLHYGQRDHSTTLNLHPPACAADYFNTKQRNKGSLKIEMLWLSKKHTAEAERTLNERQPDEQTEVRTRDTVMMSDGRLDTSISC